MANERELSIVFWIGTFVMLFLILAVLLIAVAYQRKVHALKERESESFFKIALESEQRERKRIASDLHDGISGDLVAIRNYITLLKLGEDDIYNRAILKEINTAMGDTIQNVQNITRNLMPPILHALGFVPALKDYFDRIRKWNGVNIVEKYHTTEISLTLSISYELYRIIQELVNNLLQHSAANRIYFSIDSLEDKLIIEIIDNGIPFDFFGTIKVTSGMGLKNIVSRAKHIGATLDQSKKTSENKITLLLTEKILNDTYSDYR
jgi:signal transduction histidine kinase